MFRRSIAQLPLHYGSAPAWLFNRMKKILFEISRIIIIEYGTEEYLKRISDPVCFQILGCISGFDWHSSGITTTVTGALKEMFRYHPEYGIFIFGGKGAVSRKTPEEIRMCKEIKDNERFVGLSKLTAKIDNTCIQDGYQLYHHVFFVDKKNNWAVIQQGMNLNNRTARRYHWFNRTSIDENKLTVIEPHTGIVTQVKQGNVLNFIARNSLKFQKNVIEYFRLEKPENMVGVIKKITMPERHSVKKEDYNTEKLYKIFCKIKNFDVDDFKKLISIEGVGPKTLRALALISEVVYGDVISTEDPARFSFAFGGKDGHPYPVDRDNYDKTIEILKEIVDKISVGDSEKREIFKRLGQI